MGTEKKERQLEKVKVFGEALYDMRCSGVKLEFFQDGIVDKIILWDRESGCRIGEIAMAEFLATTTGQILDERALSTDYFGELLKNE